VNIFAAVAATVASIATAHAGGVLLCNEYGCRSQPYFTPPIYAVGPPAVYMPANPPGPRPLPPAYNGPIGPPAPVYAPGPNGPVRVYPPGALGAQPHANPRHASRPDVQVPPPDGPSRKDAEADAIEQDITGFCDTHPDEPFCGRLGEYLRKHPDRAPKK
jgi:hypothetical protein